MSILSRASRRDDTFYVDRLGALSVSARQLTVLFVRPAIQATAGVKSQLKWQH